MGKNELLNLLSKRAGISYDEAEMFYDKFVQRFSKVLKATQSVKISGFGEFKGKVKKSRRVIDPLTGFEKIIPSRIDVSFSPAKIFVEKVNIKYKNLKPVIVKARPAVVEESDSNEFNITFFEPGGKREFVELEVVQAEFEPIAKEVEIAKQRDNEDYLVLPDKFSGVEKFEEIELDIPVFDFFERKKESEGNYEIVNNNEEVKINFEEVAMPEFNLSEEPRQPQEKKEAKRFFDDTQQREIPTMAFEYEEENQKRTGFWIFILVVFLIFLGGVVLLLNQYGYIHLWGEGKKVSKVEFTQAEDVVVTTPPEVKTKPETPVVEGKKTEPVITPPRVEKPAASRVVPKARKSYVIQVASFQDKKLADAFASDLKGKGYNAFVERAFVEWKGGNWYRVRVGFFDSFEQANEVAKRLKREEKVERIWVSEVTRSVTK